MDGTPHLDVPPPPPPIDATHHNHSSPHIRAAEVASRVTDGPGTIDVSWSPHTGARPTQAPFLDNDMKRIINLAKTQAPLLGGSMGLLLLSSSVTLVLPTAIGRMLDLTMDNDPSLSLETATYGLIGLFTVQALVMGARSLMLTMAGERISALIRKQTLESILRQGTGFFDAQATGELVNRLSADCTLLQKVIASSLAQGMRSLFLGVGSAGMMAYLSPKLVMFSMAVLPPVVGGAIWLNRRMKRQQRLVQDALAEATSQAADTLGNIRLVRDFGQEHVEYDRYARAIDVTYHTALQVGRSNALLEGTVFWGVNMSLVAVLAVGSTMIASQEMTVGALTSFLLYSLYFGIHTNGMSNVYADLTRGLGASQRLFDLIDLPSDPTSSMPHDGARPRVLAAPYTGEPKPPPTQPMPVVEHASSTKSEPATAKGEEASKKKRSPSRHAADVDDFDYDPPLPNATTPTGPQATQKAVNILARDDEVDQQGIEAVLRHVTFAYPERPDEIVLEDYSLELPAGKSVGLCGSSGCGKSTVARLLTRLYDPSSGQVFFDGVDLRTLDPVEMRHNIGIVAQDALLFDRTVRENLMYGRPDATEAQLIEAAKQANAYEFICELPEGFDTEVGERGVTLSGGQRARLAIARALLRQPRLLILDEASAALDAVSEQQVHAALKAALTLNTGRMTTLLIAHRLATLKTADVIHVMDHGRIVESGSFQELEAGTGLFRQMLDAQSTASTA